MSYTHDELIDFGRKWLLKSYYNLNYEFGHTPTPVIITEIVTVNSLSEQPDVLGWNGRRSILIECKTSRSDFLADLKKPFRLSGYGLGSQRWYLAPQGIIPVDKLPPKWGLLEVLPTGELRVTIKAEIQERAMEAEIDILLSLLRRLKIEKDDHVGIKRFVPPEKSGLPPSKKKATFYVEEAL